MLGSNLNGCSKKDSSWPVFGFWWSLHRKGWSWVVCAKQWCGHDFGLLPTLASGKDYVINATVSLTEHNLSTKHGRRQNKKEFNGYLASEAKNGNYEPIIIWLIIIVGAKIFFTFLQGLKWLSELYLINSWCTPLRNEDEYSSVVLRYAAPPHNKNVTSLWKSSF